MTNSFTAHNIRLDDGTLTVPACPWEVSQDAWFKAAKRALTLAFPGGLAGVRLVDLGCLEGGYATEFARLGMEVLGIEVRRSNFENCLLVKAGVDLPNLSFAHDDAWNIEKYGEFDAVFCSGLLYHLDRPREFIGLTSRRCRTICLYQTHFASEAGAPAVDKFGLSPVTENEGVRGRWFHEHDAASVDELDLEALKWASWKNQRSFWLLREELVGIIHENGFDMVFEQYDCLSAPLSADMLSGYYQTDDRCLFVGVKTGIR